MKTLHLLPTLLLSIAGVSHSVATDWPQWRGPDHTGVSRSANPPLEWGQEKNLKWQAPIEGHGSTTPIVWQDKVFVLTAVNTGKVDPSLPRPEDQPDRVFGITFPNTSFQFVVLCLDRATGETLWRAVATERIPHEGHHRYNSFASASPFCDGERLYCWFGSAGMYCYDLEGKLLWQRDLGPAKVGASLGEGCSPVVHDGKLVLVRDHQGQSMIHVLDAANGAILWEKPRDEVNAWATPAIVEHDGRTQVITAATKRVRSYDLDTGDLIWECRGLTNNVTPCPMVLDGVVYCMSGYKGSALLAIPIDDQGDVTDRVIWSSDEGTPYIPSGLLYDNDLYYCQSNQGILSARKADDGEEILPRTRLPGIGDVYASLVGAQDRIYIVGRTGTTLVVERGPHFKVLATNTLDDVFYASPALAGEQFFLRSETALYCIERGGSAVAERIDPIRPAADKPASPAKAIARPEMAADLRAASTRALPAAYRPQTHQQYVDRRMAGLTPQQRARVGQLWKEQQRVQPEMPNRGQAFIRILEQVATAP